MKRLIIPAIILAGLAALCLGQYRSRAAPHKVFQLTEPKLDGPLSLEQALAGRRSVRAFTGQRLNFMQIGQLAWAGQGITDPLKGLRTAPSAGALYPTKLYFATQDGIFMYNPDQHNLEQTSDQDMRSVLAATVLEQETVAGAACDIIVAGSARKLAAQYGKNAKRYMLLEAGHIAQNIQLQAVSLELGSVPIAALDTRDVSKICRLPKELEPIYIISVGYPAEIAEDGQARPKKAALIIAAENFRDEELVETRLVLDEAGVKTVIVSSKKGPVRGALGGTAEATILLNELTVDSYDAIVFIGGPGAREYFDSRPALDIVREAADKGKVLAAICTAPTILANAGVLRGIRATGFLSEREGLQRAGVKYTGVPVERDGLIITARDPQAAPRFGAAIAEALAGR